MIPPPDLRQIGLVVGLTAEARLARRLGAPVAVGGGDAAGARRAAEHLVARGVTGLVSFGLAGGLDPALPAGTLLVPRAVRLDDRLVPVDAALARALGGTSAHTILCGTTVAATPADKALLWRATGCAAIDLETGAVAAVAQRHGLPFAVLRAICDPAGRKLPPAALAAITARGTIGIGRVLASLLAHPRQLPALLTLARDAAAARRALAGVVRKQGQGALPPGPPPRA